MRSLALAIGMLIIQLAVRATVAEPNAQPEKREIPLKEIWAYGMPGTRDAHDLEPDKFGPSVTTLSSAEQIKLSGKSLATQILSHLQYNKPSQSALKAFAVAGTGKDALREAAEVLSGMRKPQASFPANSEVSVAFFSHLFGCYVHLNKVEQQPGLVVISYRFVPHETAQLTRHFALIPLGKLSPGEVKVDIKRSPMEKKFLDAGFTEQPRSTDAQVIAQPFRFTVKGKGE